MSESGLRSRSSSLATNSRLAVGFTPWRESRVMISVASIFVVVGSLPRR